MAAPPMANKPAVATRLAPPILSFHDDVDLLTPATPLTAWAVSATTLTTRVAAVVAMSPLYLSSLLVEHVNGGRNGGVVLAPPIARRCLSRYRQLHEQASPRPHRETAH